ncbi:XdhC family protein [Parvibaculaceae bacterium PLY_AMNH_Bact1]|nr:XdhC family protein [Parvibaculaceae bacterium PLY_AMNH_Bact1]
MKQETLKHILSAQAAKQPIVLASNLETNEQLTLAPTTKGQPDWMIAAVETAVRSDKSRVIEAPDGSVWFFNVFNPSLRLIIVGAVHIAQPLARMGLEASYDVSVVDPREAFASADRFPNVTLVSEWPDKALQNLELDARTAVVTLTHDPKLDDPALHVALKSTAFYIGALGSKKTQAARQQRLTDTGFAETEIARICGPVGLNIGAKSPAEIAISILAEITLTLRQERS